MQLGDRPVALDVGATLRDVSIAYETWGTLNADASNAVLICHAWTGDSHVTGAAGEGHPTPGWWEGIVGPGLSIDTNEWFVVCSNVLGGCQGTTGPASTHPDDARPYGSRFPVITIRDMVRAQVRLADVLGVQRWHAVVGGSMGGMQALEWAITYPNRVGSLVAIGSCLQSTAQQIALGRYWSARDSTRSQVARRRLLRRGRRRWPVAGSGNGTHGGPSDVPQRQRVHRAFRPRTR